MKKTERKTLTKNLYHWLLVLFPIIIGGCEGTMHRSSDKPMAAAMIIGVNHMGVNHSVSQFYVNGNGGGGVQRGMPSGRSYVCCVMLPVDWYPGFSVNVKWEVKEWKNEQHAENNIDNYDEVSRSYYVATVPVERYDKSYGAYVHFFTEGRVRIVSSKYTVASEKHPVKKDDPHASQFATFGTKISTLAGVKK